MMKFPSLDEVIQLPISDSTNDDTFEALNRYGACLIWTLNQRRGRGSRGRTWLAPEDHVLALSIGLHGGDFPAPHILSYPLFAGVLLYDNLSSIVPEDKFGLKWPNDLLYGDRKLAGILCESRWSGSEVRIVIGIGINLKAHPSLESLPKGYASLDELDDPPTPRAIVQALAENLPHKLAALCDPVTLNREWLKRSPQQIGTRMCIRVNGRQTMGVFRGLSADGCMMLEDNDGSIQKIQQSCDDFQIL